MRYYECYAKSLRRKLRANSTAFVPYLIYFDTANTQITTRSNRFRDIFFIDRAEIHYLKNRDTYAKLKAKRDLKHRS